MQDIAALSSRLRRGEGIVAGCLSGTSADGIDVALVRFGRSEPPRDLGPPELLHFATLPFPAEVAAALRPALAGRGTVGKIALLDRDLGRAFGAAVRSVASPVDVTLDLIGSHGQTVYHHDGCEPSGPATWQIGQAEAIARACGAPVVSDFRQGDIAAGGEGAPLVGLVDDLLFQTLERPAAILNLGGLANLTILSAERAPRAFDTGPAGSLLDGLARLCLDQSMDRDGRVAAQGEVDEAWLAELLRHPYLDRPPPKSTGRDTFGDPWIRRVLAASGGSAGGDVPRLLATAVEFIAVTVAQALERFVEERPRRLWVAGGGVHHPVLMRALARRTGLETASTRACGVDPDAREALAFAVLAARFVLGVPSTRETVTGARSGARLGKLCLPPA